MSRHRASLLFSALALLCPAIWADAVDDCEKPSGSGKIEACTQVIESGRWKGADLVWAYGNRGDAKRAKRDFAGALADYDRAIEFDPKDPINYVSRGHARFGLRDFDGAIADFNRALAIDSKMVRAYIGRGNAKRSGLPAIASFSTCGPPG